MPVFEYRGLTPAGKQVKGLLEAESSRSLRQQLKRSGVFLTDVLAERESGAPRKQNGTAGVQSRPALGSREVQLGKLLRGRVTSDDLAIFTRQLSTLLHAGVTLVDALTALVDQTEKERLKRIVSEVKTRVNEGSSLAEDFLLSSANGLAGLDGELAPLAGVVHVVHVPSARPGYLLHVYLDAEAQVGMGVFA